MAIPKTPLVAIVCQTLTFIFALLVMIPTQGVMEDTYIMQMNTSKYGHDSMVGTKLFNLNNSNPIYAALTAPPVPAVGSKEKVAGPSALSGLNDAILHRLEVNMSDPKTVQGIYNTPLKDIMSGGKDLIASERGQFKIANGIADFLRGMAAQMSGKIPNDRTAAPPHAAAPAAPGAPHKLRRGMYARSQESVSTQLVSAPSVMGIVMEMMNSLERIARNESSSQGIERRQFGPPKVEPPIPATGPWTPAMQALQETGPTLTAGLKKAAVEASNEGMAAFRAAYPIYDFYNIYNSCLCWGKYTPSGPKIAGCSSSADWKDVDLTANIQRMTRLSAPNAQIAGPNGLGDNMERVLGAMRVLMMMSWIGKILTVVNAAASMIFSIVGIVCVFKGLMAPGTVVTANFGLSAGTASMVVPNGFSALISALVTAIVAPPMNRMSSMETKIGVPFIILSVIGAIFSTIGSVAWYKMWKKVKLMEKEAKEAEKRNASLEHGSVTQVNVSVDKYEKS